MSSATSPTTRPLTDFCYNTKQHSCHLPDCHRQSKENGQDKKEAVSLLLNKSREFKIETVFFSVKLWTSRMFRREKLLLFQCNSNVFVNLSLKRHFTGIKSVTDYWRLIKTNVLEVAWVARWTAVLSPAVSCYCHAQIANMGVDLDQHDHYPLKAYSNWY